MYSNVYMYSTIEYSMVLFDIICILHTYIYMYVHVTSTCGAYTLTRIIHTA